MRERLQFSQQELADIVGVSHDTVQRWLSGDAAMTVDQMALSAHAMGFRPAELIGLAESLIISRALRPIDVAD